MVRAAALMRLRIPHAHPACACASRMRLRNPPDAAPRVRAVDFVSMQSVLFNGAARSWWAQTRTLVKLQARLTED